ncbi:MAG: RND family transporter [Bradymonadales bacterium]|nr:MAG: RND family transporter [Bradymonadales bacterium]
MAWLALQLRVDAGFEKQLPMNHPFVQTYLDYQEEFGGGDRILIAVQARDGSVFQEDRLRQLKALTDEVFFLPGINRSNLTSIFTPNVRFIEVVDGGFAGGNVVPADFDFSEEAISEVRENVLKADLVGRLISHDFRSALISAELVEINPQTRERIDYLSVAKQLEDLRSRFENEEQAVHIIGFVKAVGDVAEGAAGVLVFFLISFFLTAALVFYFTLSWKLGALPLICSSISVVWCLGLITLFGYGLDPMSILVPFLIFAIGVSHGVQMVNGIGSEIYSGKSMELACRGSFRKLVIPGCIALLSDSLGFLLIMVIEIRMIQELAITASLGVAAIIFSNLIILPLLASYLSLDEDYSKRLKRSAELKRPLWKLLSQFAKPSWGLPTVVIAILLGALTFPFASRVQIGDLEEGVPELRAESRYNQDSSFITRNFSVGVDILSVLVEAESDACIDFELMSAIDDFQWNISQLPSVQSTFSLPQVARRVNAGWNEGHPAWRVLPRDPQVLSQAVAGVETSSGLLNADCSVMPVLIFGRDHRAETIEEIVDEIERLGAIESSGRLHYRLATGNMGIMAATNEVVRESQFLMLFLIYASVFLLCVVSFRSIRASLCIILPLCLVSIWCYALMYFLGIGLKVSTLPVAALGVGIGVDYGIYIFSRFRAAIDRSGDLQEAFVHTLQVTGNAVLITGLTLGLGVSTWIFSDLQFQADMGLLLSFMFLMNMLGAVFLLPALASLMFRGTGDRQVTPSSASKDGS